MFCIHCGAKNQHEGNFCFQCGKPLIDVGTPAVESDELTKSQAELEEDKQSQANPAAMPNENAASTSGNQNFFITVWQGEWGLAKTYWIIGVVLGSLLGVVLNPSNHAGLLSLVLMVAIMAYQTWSLVGIWRAAGKHRGTIAWRYLSRGAALIGTMYVLVVAIGVFKQVFPEFGEVQEPTYKVGDTWNYNQPSYTITRNFDNVTWTVIREKKGGQLIEGPVSKTFVTPLDFPIKPGKTWTTSNKTVWNGTRTDKYAVLEWETIEVAAGVFRALKIQHRVDLDGKESESTMWYSPKAKNFVLTTGGFDLVHTGELLSYSLK